MYVTGVKTTAIPMPNANYFPEDGRAQVET